MPAFVKGSWSWTRLGWTCSDWRAASVLFFFPFGYWLREVQCCCSFQHRYRNASICSNWYLLPNFYVTQCLLSQALAWCVSCPTTSPCACPFPPRLPPPAGGSRPWASGKCELHLLPSLWFCGERCCVLWCGLHGEQLKWRFVSIQVQAGLRSSSGEGEQTKPLLLLLARGGGTVPLTTASVASVLFLCRRRAVNRLFVSVEIGFIKNGIKKQVNKRDAFLEESYLVPSGGRASSESWALVAFG